MGQAYTRLDAKFKASVKDGEGQERIFPAGMWGLALFEELLQFVWLMACQVPVLLYSKICSGSAVSQYVSFPLFSHMSSHIHASSSLFWSSHRDGQDLQHVTYSKENLMSSWDSVLQVHMKRGNIAPPAARAAAFSQAGRDPLGSACQQKDTTRDFLWLSQSIPGKGI